MKARLGMTLTELLVVLAVLGILAGIMAMSIRPSPARLAADAVLGVVQQARFDAIKTNRPIVIVLDSAAGEIAVRRATTSGAIDCSAGATQPVRTLSLGEYRAVSLSGSVEAFVWLPSGQPRECTGGRLASTVEMTLSSGDSTRTVAVTGGGEVVLQ